MKYSRFDLEAQIMDCWNVTTDINTLCEAVGDRPEPLTEDEIMNTLLGMKQLYELKFEKLFNIFEESLDKVRQPNIPMLEGVNRFEVINHAVNVDHKNFGRFFTHQDIYPLNITYSYQDDSKTLKIFLSK